MLTLPRDSGGVADASLPFAVRRLLVDEEDAVAVVDQLRAVREEERLQPGGIAGGRGADGVRHIIAARDEARPHADGRPRTVSPT